MTGSPTARSVSSQAAGRWAVAILFQSNGQLDLRLADINSLNEDAAIGHAIKEFREGDLPDDAASLIELAVPIAARSDSEDTQQAEGAANLSPQVQELIEAACLAERILNDGDIRSRDDQLTVRNHLRTALQNVKGAA